MPEVRAFGMGSERPKVLLVGCGGAGCNTLQVVPPEAGLDRLAVSDFPHPSLLNVPRRLLLEKSGLRGLAAMDEKAVKTLGSKAEQSVATAVGDADLVIPLAGLGGEMGSWGAGLVARVAVLKGATTMAIVTTPFSAEGSNRRAVAEESLKVLRGHAHGIVTLGNDRLLRIAPHLPILRAFEVMGRIAIQPVLDLLRVLKREDLPALRTALRGATEWQLGIGEGTRDHPDLAAVDAAFRSPWITRRPEDARVAILVATVPEGQDRLAKGILYDVNVRTARADLVWGAAIGEPGDPPRATVLLGF